MKWSEKYWSGCHFLLQGIPPIQGSNPRVLHCRQIIYCLSHQGAFHVLANINNAAVNTEVQIISETVISFPLEIYPGVKLLGGMVSTVSFFIFWGTSTHFPQWLHQFTFPPTVHKGSLLSTSSPTLVICYLFHDSQSNRCEVIISLWFDWHFPDDYWCWAHFHAPVGHLTNGNMKQVYLPSLEKCLFLLWSFAYLLITFDYYFCCLYEFFKYDVLTCPPSHSVGWPCTLPVVPFAVLTTIYYWTLDLDPYTSDPHICFLTIAFNTVLFHIIWSFVSLSSIFTPLTQALRRQKKFCISFVHCSFPGDLSQGKHSNPYWMNAEMQESK